MHVGDFVYVVMVGSSLKEMAKFQLIDLYCRDCGLYFEPWSDEVDSHIERLAARFYVSGNQMAFPYRSVSVSVSWLYKTILDDSFTTYEANLPLTHAEVTTNLHHRTDFLLRLHHLSCNTPCLSLQRKNLSFAKKVEKIKAEVCGIGVAACFIIDAIVSSILGW